MKIRIEGCTTEELADWSPYLDLNAEYEAYHRCNRIWCSKTSDGGDLSLIYDPSGDARCMHLPPNARWVEVK